MRKSSVAVGDTLFDLKGHAYRVVSLSSSCRHEELDEGCVELVLIDEDPSHESSGLTRRQRQIARLLANRATNTEIAAALGISVHTARHHSQKVLEKLGIRSRSQVRMKFARDSGHGDHQRRPR
jgi:DNA-binding CsgD family transcriptional regulator